MLLAGVAEFLTDAATGPAIPLLEGEPGIGKTDLWAASHFALGRL